LFSDEEELVKSFLCILFNTFFPVLDLFFVVRLEVLAEGIVELLDIFVLFSVFDRLRKNS